MNDFSEKAIELAKRPYISIVVRNETTSGDGHVFLASNPEIKNCKAQGLTVEEAKENLLEVRIAMIEHLLEHNLTVPEPAVSDVATGDVLELEQFQISGLGTGVKYTVLEPDEKPGAVLLEPSQ